MSYEFQAASPPDRAKSFRIRTSKPPVFFPEKRFCISFRIRTCRHTRCKSFRIRSYRKGGRGARRMKIRAILFLAAFLAAGPTLAHQPTPLLTQEEEAAVAHER